MANSAGIPGFRRRKISGGQFVSSEQTGTGASQNVAHGLGVVPAKVAIIPSTADGNANAWAQGAHTKDNVVVTVTSGVKFYVHAWP